jgi:ubiquinone/menaquinone biosynthesis C-methylase UbiE
MDIYRQESIDKMNADTVLLEVGCGFSNMFLEDYKKVQKVIGVDINPDYIKEAYWLDQKVVAPMEDMSEVPAGSVDLVMNSWVLEHIYDPEKAFTEVFRVLKPGGYFVFVTPNTWNYVVILNRFLPSVIRNSIARMLTKDLAVDPMPTHYKANSPRALNGLAKRAGLRVKKLELNGDPTFVAINKFFFYIGVAIEAMLALPFMTWARVNIVGVTQKPSE